MSNSYRPKDDGYRGLLYNPATGRYFMANAVTARRKDLERVEKVGERGATVVASKDDEDTLAPVVETPEETESAVKANVAEANEAMKDILAQAKSTSDKQELMALGAQVGAKLTKNMNPETMVDRIEKQVAAILAATE